MTKKVKTLLAMLPLLIVGILAGHFLTLGTEAFNEATATAEFCGLCHASIVESETFKTSNHRMNRFGVTAECGECHTREGFYLETWDHVSSGIRSLVLGIARGHLTDPKLQDTIGEEMAHNARDWFVEVDSAPCLRCHNDPNGYPMSGRPGVAREHEKAKHQGISCIGCHYNLVHEPQPVRPEFKAANTLKDDH
ncbi:MAG: hypothetical protein D6758_03125 [Gammaproteobacteria bacterium]|nr:MAG: hypothetical protein D6758_03125 [Gammaproteobacteria bacterium]